MADSNKISTSTAPKPVGLYPHARKVGNLLFLSGVGPRTAGSDANDSGIPGLVLDHNGNFKAFDFEAQVHSVFKRESNFRGERFFLGGIGRRSGLSCGHETLLSHV